MQPGFPPTDRYDHTFVIYLQGGVGAYPTSPPIVQWHTPIFHPNIITPKENDAEIQELARLLAVDVKALPERMREDEHLARLVEELKGFVCLDVLSANWSPWIGLDAVVIEIANMVRFKTYNLDSVLDHAAEKWTRERQMAHALPLETVGLTEMQETEIGALLLARGV
jgi:ubiquitin-protein ligase